MIDNTARRFLYYPDRIPREMPPPHWVSGAREVWMKCRDGKNIHGLWWPEPAGRPVVLFLHGNAQELYSWSLVREDLAELGCRMLMIDYHGYGKSEGEPGEENLYMDGHAALQWLDSQGVGPAETLIFGKSLGGAVACEISRGLDVLGLVLESTFTSLASVARHLFPFMKPGQAPGEVYDSIGKLPDITCPVLVIHGDRDQLIPVGEGVALFEAAGEPKELIIVEGAGHNDVSMVAGAGYVNSIRAWLNEIVT